MTQADSENTTAMLVDPTRRRFINIAAGASIVSVGSLVAAAAVPNATPEVSSAPVDPIYAAIAACREAERVSDQAYARVDELCEEARSKFGSGEGHYSICSAHVASVLGIDQDKYTDGPAFALWNSFDEFATTEPTTLAGLFAMLIYADEITDHKHEALSNPVIFSTLAAAAKSLSKGGVA